MLQKKIPFYKNFKKIIKIGTKKYGGNCSKFYYRIIFNKKKRILEKKHILHSND